MFYIGRVQGFCFCLFSGTVGARRLSGREGEQQTTITSDNYFHNYFVFNLWSNFLDRKGRFQPLKYADDLLFSASHHIKLNHWLKKNLFKDHFESLISLRRGSEPTGWMWVCTQCLSTALSRLPVHPDDADTPTFISSHANNRLSRNNIPNTFEI